MDPMARSSVLKQTGMTDAALALSTGKALGAGEQSKALGDG